MDAVDNLLAESRVAEAIALLTARSATGEAAATYRLMNLTARGVGTAKNWLRTFELLSLAAHQGSADAEAEIALLGGAAGVPPDFATLMRIPPRQVLCEAPRIRRMDGFLSPALATWLIDQARGRTRRAQTLEPGDGLREAPQETPNRTNNAFVFGPFGGGVLMALIAERIAAAVGVPTDQFEATQIFHYEAGQEFRLHTDYVVNDSVGQRIATFLIYLNENMEGGETWFPRPGLKVAPATGAALYFANVDLAGAPDPLSLHAGLPPSGGEKWLLSQWVRNRPFLGD